jgi:phosphoribosyl-AMP cyclohydrolase
MKKKIATAILISTFTYSLMACSDSADVKVGDKKIENTNIAQNKDIDVKEVEKETAKKVIDYSKDDFFTKQDKVSIEHIHGVGYAHNDGSIYFASHDGLKIFNNNTWYTTKKENNDYMGYTPVNEGFYTSGHPGKDGTLPDPFGVVKSLDGGKTLLSLDLLQVSDFHIMDVGYFNNDIFVYNTHQNPKMDIGLFYSKDDTKTWTKAKLSGVPQEVSQPADHPSFTLSVHPKEEGRVAFGTSEGLYESKDYGNTFTKAINESFQITATKYTESGILMGIWNGGPQLVKWTNEGQFEQFNIPKFVEQDAIMMISYNPKSEGEIVLVSYKGNIYLTKNSGKEWQTIVQNGKSITK